jgi:phosphocarrier protein HPr
MIRKQLLIINRLGLHARAAAKLVSTAAHHVCAVRIEREGKSADAKSIMAVMMLAAAKGSTITIEAEGEDEAAAVDAITTLIEQRFGEDE